MKIPTDICPKAARIYRTLNRPVIRSNVDVDCKLYQNEDSDKPIASLKVSGFPDIKLLDLILAIASIKIFFSVVGAVVRFFKN